jgi:hypothetical protein
MTMQRAKRLSHPRSQLWTAVAAALVGAVGSGLITPPAFSAAAAAENDLIAVGGLSHVPHGSIALGSMRGDQRISFAVAIAPPDPKALATYASAVSTPGNPLFHHYMSAPAFAAAFAPSTRAVSRVEGALQTLGFNMGAVPSDRLFVPVSATASTVDRALHTNLVSYRLPAGTVGWAASAAPRLPRDLASGISGVVGLDNVASPTTSVSTLQPASSTAASSRGHVTSSGAPGACLAATGAAQRSGGWTESDLAKAYGLTGLYDQGDLAAGQTIGVFELEPFLMSDVATFDRCVFGVSHTSQVAVQQLDGFNLVGPGEGEAALDVEEISAMAPAAEIVVYEAPNTTFGALDEYAAMISQDKANIISTSWGECEQALAVGAPDSTELENTLFEEAATQGQTFFASAGDDGSDDCANTPFSSGSPVAPYLSVDDPGAQPYVVSVGGTSLASDRQPLGPNSETVWNDGSNAGSGGGGLSELWSMPEWQAASGVAGLATSGARETPDVSASGNPSHGSTIFASSATAPASGGQYLPGARGARRSYGLWGTIGGTSAAAPVWAAVAAEIAASGPTGTSCSSLPSTAGGPDLGFIAPELYGVAAEHYSASFHDVVKGNNDVFALGKGYEAGIGYDLASGLGSPDVTNGAAPGLAAYLCAEATGTAISPPLAPVIVSISPSSGPTSGGGTLLVQLSTALPQGASVEAQIGATRATVLVASGTNVELSVPTALVTPSAPSFAGAGPVRVVLTLATSTGTVSSGPSAASTYQYLDEAAATRTPTVTGIGPSAGSPVGGNAVTVYGSDFAASTDQVTFGGQPAESVQEISSSQLRVGVPPETSLTSCATGAGFYPAAACQVQVVVANSDGVSPTMAVLPAISGAIVFSTLGVVDPTPGTEVAPSSTEYDYSPAPVITAVTPTYSSPTGDQAVTITGTGFNFDTFYWVNFGPASSTASQQVKITYLSNSMVRIDPPHGPRDEPSVLRGGLSVQTGGGVSNVVRFGYAGVPRIVALSAHSGPSSGGSVLHVTALKALGTTKVDFVTAATLGRAARIVSARVLRVDKSVVTVRTPPVSVGTVDVELCTAVGCSKAVPSRDRYLFERVARKS